MNWGLQRLWVEGTLPKLFKEHFKMDPTFQVGENNIIQPKVMEVSKERDKW